MENSVKGHNSLEETIRRMSEDDYREIAARGISTALAKHPFIVAPLIICILLLGVNSWMLHQFQKQSAVDRALLTEEIVECYRTSVSPALAE